MRFLAPLILTLAITASAFGITGDIAVTSFTTSKSALTSGERFTATVRVRNGGPDAVPMLVSLDQAFGLILNVDAPPEWRCTQPTRMADSVSCFTGTLAAGQEQQMIATILAPRALVTLQEGYRLTARVTGAYEDPDTTNNAKFIGPTVTPHSSQVDLTITTPVNTLTVLPGTPVEIPIVAQNRGPADASNVILRFAHGTDLTGYTFTGTGWTCTQTAERDAACTRSLLRANETSTLFVRFTPQTETPAAINAVITAEQIFETKSDNDFVNVTVGVGSEQSWHRLLVPITATNIPGAFGSLWNTDVSMIFLASENPEVRPAPCTETATDCFTPGAPLRRPFDARQYGYLVTNPNDIGGQFLYVRLNDANQVRLNARVYDKSRHEETAGSEIPIVREDQFTSDVMSMLNVPVAPHYRHTLRVYDENAVDGTGVIIRVYANDQAQPKATVVRRLARPADTRGTTSALLPTRPAYLQVDLRDITSLDGLTSVRVEVEPAIAQTRLWSFIAITNNDTHHVTLVSPQ
jgi:Domain of unknown function DUF11